MEYALELARGIKSDIPVASVIVKENKIIAFGVNEKEKKQNAIYHAEILAIKMANKILNNWRLEECEMYVTLEPCPMCAWAIIQSGIKILYFGSCFFIKFISSISDSVSLSTTTYSKSTISLTNLAVFPV